MASFKSNFRNRYEILNEGKGGNVGSQILICKDLVTEEMVTIKTINAKHLSNIKVERSLIREALAYYLIGDHPHIVHGKYFDVLDGQPFIALEYVPFKKKNENNLYNYFQESLSLNKILEWSIHICLAMDYILNRGILTHRDIKPTNILITPDKVLKIADFSLIKLDFNNFFINKILQFIYERKPELKPIYEEREKIVGTINWMSPEQFKGKADVRSDIYSFGLVLYQMCNQGKLPFSDQSNKRYVILNKENLKKTNNKILLPIIIRCLEKNPKNRYQDFFELKKDLQIINEKKIRISPPKNNRYLTMDNVNRFFKSL